jgi:hypothetical protein
MVRTIAPTQVSRRHQMVVIPVSSSGSLSSYVSLGDQVFHGETGA